jgi:hypothetical protein
MFRQMQRFFAGVILVLLTASGIAVQAGTNQVKATSAAPAHLAGRWRVKFILADGAVKNLVFESKPKGMGSFLLLDTGPDNQPVAEPLPAVWSQTSNDRVNFSAEVELPFGTCCREVGTLILKGKFTSSSSISGKLIFVGSSTDDENLYGFRSLTGTFTATRVLN